jgi:hypothetical protein
MEWSRKWRININADKTEYSIFSRLKQHPGHTILKLNNKILKYNRNPKLLGVTLDEKLNFGQHILNIEKKAGNSLGNFYCLYNSLIGSVLQYASPLISTLYCHLQTCIFVKQFFQTNL